MCIKPQLARRKSRPISAKYNGVRQPRCLRPQQSSRVEVSKFLSSVRAAKRSKNRGPWLGLTNRSKRLGRK